VELIAAGKDDRGLVALRSPVWLPIGASATVVAISAIIGK
jgi:hypothetical protein